MTLVEILKQSLIFSGLSEKDLQVLSGIVVRHSFTKGERLFNEGEAADGFYLLVSGQVKLCKVSSDGREKVLHFVKPMETFAEMSEAYFGMNDFFPFNRAELKREEPALHGLLRDIWGPLPAERR